VPPPPFLARLSRKVSLVLWAWSWNAATNWPGMTVGNLGAAGDASTGGGGDVGGRDAGAISRKASPGAAALRPRAGDPQPQGSWRPPPLPPLTLEPRVRDVAQPEALQPPGMRVPGVARAACEREGGGDGGRGARGRAAAARGARRSRAARNTAADAITLPLRPLAPRRAPAAARGVGPAPGQAPSNTLAGLNPGGYSPPRLSAPACAGAAAPARHRARARAPSPRPRMLPASSGAEARL
jgi:hypothetical protein